MLTFLALQILNLSIYNTDCYVFNDFFPAKNQVKDINPIDSFAELMVENVAGYQNAFPEPKQQDDKQSGELKHNISFKMIHLNQFASIPEKPELPELHADNRLTGFCNQYSFLFWKEINHPPA